MPDIAKLNAIAPADFNKVDGIAKGDIAKISGFDMPSSGTQYVSGAAMHLVAANATSYSGPGATVWNDISGSGNNVSLINGPTEPTAGDNFIRFDGVDDYGQHTWVSGEYFYADASNYTQFPTASCSFVASFPEDGTTGLVPRDALCQIGSRKQSSNMRCFQMRAEYRGVMVLLAYGSSVFIKWPSNDTTNFQYNSASGYYEPKPNRVLNMGVRWQRSPATGYRHVGGYLNGAPYASSGFTGGSSQTNGLASESRTDYTYANASAVRRGQAQWLLEAQHNSSGTILTNGFSADIREVMLYTGALSDAEFLQNHNAYVSAYGPLN